MKLSFLGLIGLCIASVASAAPPPISALKWQRRIVLIAAPDPRDSRSIAQRRILSSRSPQYTDRDVSVVEISGAQVTGVSDTAAALRHRYRLDAKSFAVLLIGKDGHVALRSTEPIPAERLEKTIDGMPMRRAGQR